MTNALYDFDFFIIIIDGWINYTFTSSQFTPIHTSHVICIYIYIFQYIILFLTNYTTIPQFTGKQNRAGIAKIKHKSLTGYMQRNLK